MAGSDISVAEGEPWMLYKTLILCFMNGAISDTATCLTNSSAM